MRLVPATLDRWLLAGLLLLPTGGVLASVALEGNAGRRTAAIVIAAAALYAGVVWLAGLRRELGAQLASPRPAPPEADMEPLARTAARAALRAALLLAVPAALAPLELAAVGLGLAGGVGLAAALAASRLQAWESAHVGRLARARDGRLLVFWS